jgi:hypothetical protein
VLEALGDGSTLLFLSFMRIVYAASTHAVGGVLSLQGRWAVAQAIYEETPYAKDLRSACAQRCCKTFTGTVFNTVFFYG